MGKTEALQPGLTRGQAARQLQRLLDEGGVEPAPREGRQLVAAVAGCSVQDVILHEDIVLNISEINRLNEFFRRRIVAEPLAYVLQRQPFWSRDWRVTPDVLIPRPDTEMLVKAVLNHLPPGQAARVAEVGVGSGAVLGSVLLERPLVQGVGSDISEVVVALAQHNLQEAGVAGRAELRQTDMLQGVTGPFEVIFSNPPYISEDDYARLEPCVRDHEPKLALVADDEGLACYRALVPQAWPLLVAGGLLALEIGATQAQAVCQILLQQGFMRVDVLPDLAGRNRVVRGIKP